VGRKSLSIAEGNSFDESEIWSAAEEIYDFEKKETVKKSNKIYLGGDCDQNKQWKIQRKQ